MFWVFVYEVDENNLVCVAFILMELLFGSVAIDILGGYNVYYGMIPKEYR